MAFRAFQLSMVPTGAANWWEVPPLPIMTLRYRFGSDGREREAPSSIFLHPQALSKPNNPGVPAPGSVC